MRKVIWPIVFKTQGEFLPTWEDRRLRWDEPLVFIPVLRHPLETGRKITLMPWQFEVTDFVLIALSVLMIILIGRTPSLTEDASAALSGTEMVRLVSALMILVSLFDRDGGRIQTGILVVALILHNRMAFGGMVDQGMTPFMISAMIILALQFVIQPGWRFWLERADVRLNRQNAQ